MVEESVHVTFDEQNSLFKKPISDDIDEVEQNLKKLDIHLCSNEDQKKINKVQEASSSQQGVNESPPKEWKFVHNHLTEQILGDSS